MRADVAPASFLMEFLEFFWTAPVRFQIFHMPVFGFIVKLAKYFQTWAAPIFGVLIYRIPSFSGSVLSAPDVFNSHIIPGHISALRGKDHCSQRADPPAEAWDWCPLCQRCGGFLSMSGDFCLDFWGFGDLEGRPRGTSNGI